MKRRMPYEWKPSMLYRCYEVMPSHTPSTLSCQAQMFRVWIFAVVLNGISIIVIQQMDSDVSIEAGSHIVLSLCVGYIRKFKMHVNVKDFRCCLHWGDIVNRSLKQRYVSPFIFLVEFCFGKNEISLNRIVAVIVNRSLKRR